MGDFLSALGDIATNEIAYRNAMIAATVLMFAALGELVAEKAGTINISLEGMMLAGALHGGRRCGPDGFDVGRPRSWPAAPACSSPGCRPT